MDVTQQHFCTLRLRRTCIWSKRRKQCNREIDTVLKELDFKRLVSDFGINMKVDASYIALYVDNMLLVGRRLERIKEVKGSLHVEFKSE